MDTATTEIYTLSLHDALPIFEQDAVPQRRQVRRLDVLEADVVAAFEQRADLARQDQRLRAARASADRKSTRLNSSHRCISYAVFCLKKKKYHTQAPDRPLASR